MRKTSVAGLDGADHTEDEQHEDAIRSTAVRPLC